MYWRLPWAVVPIVAAAVAGPAQAQVGPNCGRLEAQLNAFDRSANDPARAEQIRRFEDAANSQQNEIDRQEAAARQMGCNNNSFFVLFSGQPAQCGPINAKIQQMRANLDRIHSDLARLQSGAGPEREAQRRAILVALAQNNCGPQYRAAVAATQPSRGGLFESLFGPGTVFNPGGETPGWSSPGGTYRTLCVRTCDGYYYPISFATTSARFAEDEKICQRSCPAAEVMLFAHRNPGEDASQAVSINGQPYTALPNAFKYRQAFDPACSCRHPGESWAQALRNVEDVTVERGDIIVNEERARLLSQPRDAHGRPIRPDLRAGKPEPNAAAAPPAPAATANTPTPAAAAPIQEGPTKPDPKRPVRSVGPIFIPAR